MKRAVQASLFTIAVVGIALIVFPVAAQVAPLTPEDAAALGLAAGGDREGANLIAYVATIVRTFLALLGVLAFLFIVYGGLKYITSGGDESQAAAGKRTVIYAVLGIIMVGLAAVIVNFTFGAIGITSPLPEATSDLPTSLMQILNGFLVLVGIVSLIFIVYGALKYITSGGDESQAAEGKRAVVFAVMGIVLIGIAAVIVNFVALNADLSDATIPGTTNADLRSTVLLILNGFLTLVGVTALVFTIYGGAKYITSGGDSSQAEEAKRTILYAVIGIVVIGIAAVIVNFVGRIVGVSTGLPGGNNLPATIFALLNGFLVLAGVVALTFVIYGGLKYIISGGDSSETEAAKSTILYAVIGIVVIGIAAVIVNFVANIAGLPTGLAATNDLVGTLLNVLNGFLVLAGVIALGVIIYGGFKYITSGGDEDGAEDGRNAILFAVIGLMVIALAGVVVNFVVGIVT